jgi:hypothetical protein
MHTVRTLEAEWRQVLPGSMSMGTKEDELSYGHIRAARFHHIMVCSHLVRVLTLDRFFLHFFILLGGCSKPRITKN